jgi:hypothetical protein
MYISSNHADLFRASTTVEQLDFFRSLLETDTLTVDLTLALLKIIHKELSTRQNGGWSGYKGYAQIIESLNYHKSDMLKQVVDIWKPNQITPPAEWFSRDGMNNL